MYALLQTGAHTKTDLKVHLVWIPKYRKRILTGEIAVRVRDIIRQKAMEHEIDILSGKVACDHIHLFVSGNITDEMIQKYISEQEGEPINDEHRFQIDSFKSIAL